MPENLPNCLKTLSCDNNELTRLPEILPNYLVLLYCDNNKLTRLPKILPKSLSLLKCYNETLLGLYPELKENEENSDNLDYVKSF